MMHAGAGGGNGPLIAIDPLSGLNLQRINQRDRLMGPRLLSTLIGRVTPVAMLLLVALASMPAEAVTKKAAPAVTKKAAPKGTGNPFDLLKGYWTGGGTVTPMKGNAEKVSCKVTYIVAGSAVSQNMRCAGTDYKVNTSSKLTYSGGKISGSWNESTYSAAGSVSGTAKGSVVHARISGDKFSGRMSINVSGSRHTINIVQLDNKTGAYRPVASVSLHR